MDAQELRNLQEAYLEVVENQQQNVNEIFGLGRKKGTSSRADAIMNTSYFKKKQDEADAQALANLRGMFSKDPEERKRTAHRMSRSPDAENRTDLRKIEEVDLYDIILSHLLDEGYADTQEAAEAIMVNMSEEWRESIVEGFQPVSDNAAESMRRKEASLRPGGYPGQDTTANWKRHKKLQSGMAKTGVKPI
jgi:hypothetical protein